MIQPSYIPWRGYFDLIRRADVFVFYDDVQYDKHGWRNRNVIKTASGLQWLTVPTHAHGNVEQGILISSIPIDNRTNWRRKHLESIRHAYRKAPYFETTFAMLSEALGDDQERLADFTIAVTTRLAEFLGLRPEFVRSSDLGTHGFKTTKLIQTLEAVRATHYISGPSAQSYIEPEAFVRAGIGLEYVDYRYAAYPQLHGPFAPAVSVIDLLMMVGPNAIDLLRPTVD